MSEQAKENHAEKKNTPKPAPLQVGPGLEQAANTGGLGESLLWGAAFDGLDSQAARLGSTQMQAAQRARMASGIGRVQGNQHLSQVIQRMPEISSSGLALPTIQRELPEGGAPPPATTQAATPPPPATTTATPDQAGQGGDADSKGLSPEDARRLVFARTTLSQVPPLKENDQKTLDTTLKDTTAYATLLERNQKRDELKTATDALEETKRNLQDVNGPPTAEMVNKKDAEAAQVKSLTDRVTELDKMLQAILKSLNTTEDGLIQLVTVDFPAMFIGRGKQIALQELKENKEIAQKEKAQYQDVITLGGNNDPVGMRNGLRSAAQDLTNRQKDIDEDKLKIQEAHKNANPGGAPDNNGNGNSGGGTNQSTGNSSAYDLAHEPEIRERMEKRQNEYNKQRMTYAQKYKILYRDDVDVSVLATANDAQLEAMVGGKVDQVLADIQTTEDNINGDKVKIWSLKDIVDMTKQSLGIEKNQTLLGVVDNHIQQAKADEEDNSIETAVKALAMTAAIVASIVTLNPGIAIGVGVLVGVIDTIEAATTNERKASANNVALDQAVAKMSAEDPEYTWLIAAIANFVLDAVALGTVFKEVRAATATLEAFSKAARRALPAKEAEELINIAKTQIKPFVNIAGQLESIGKAMSQVDRVKVGALIAKYAEEGYAEAFLQMTKQGRVLPLNEESIRAAVKDKWHADELVRDKITNPKGESAGFYDRISKTIFLKDTSSTSEMAGRVVHELTHEFQHNTEVALFMNKYEFYQEFQAHIAQQEFLNRVVSDYGKDVVPEASKWLIDADDELIAKTITQRYGASPVPEIGVVRMEQDEVIQKMVEIRLGRMDRVKQMWDKLETKMDK